MKVLRQALITFFVIAGGCGVAFAANGGIGLSLVSYTQSNPGSQQSQLGYTIVINALVTNYDSTQYVGFIDFGLHNTNYTLTDNDDVFSRPSYSGVPIILNGGESIPAIFNVTLNPSYFAPGPDVVVVWPITAVNDADSIRIDLNIIGNNGVTDTVATAVNDPNNAPLAFSVLENEILLLNVPAQTNFKQVRILDLTGREVFELNSAYIKQVPIPDIPKGIYLAEFLASDGTVKVLKFVH